MGDLPPELICSIIESSNLPMLYVWALVSISIRAVVALEFRNRHERYLEPFIGNVALFMEQLRNRGGIVAGSLALAYFEGASWSANNCDIYLGYFDHPHFLSYLKKEEGYTVIEDGVEMNKVDVIWGGAQENDNPSVCTFHLKVHV